MSATLTASQWNTLVEQIASAFRFSAEEQKRLAANKTARLVAAIPFVAACQQPERTALAHLAVFVLASAPSCRQVFDHGPLDNRDPLARLAPIADFQGGDPEIIDRGMRLLGLVMVNGYQKDLDKDAHSSEYNPLLARAWDRDRIASELSAPLRSASSPLDPYMSLDEALRGFWDNP